MGEKKSPVAFNTPALHCVIGSTMVGKTFYVKKIILNSGHLFKQRPLKVIYAYEVFQDIFHDLVDWGVSFFQGCPSKEEIESWAKEEPGHKLLILDDQMVSIINSEAIAKLFLIYAHHMNFSVIFIKQVTFDKGKFSHMISLQTQYFHLFSNLRDQQNIRCLARQIYTSNIQLFLSAYKLATKELYRCLVVDLHPIGDGRYRLRTNIFDEHPIIYS
jgi:hypothetical protein